MSTLLNHLFRLYALLGTAAFFLYDAGALFGIRQLSEQTWSALIAAPILLVALLAHSQGFYDELLTAPEESNSP